MPSTDIGCSPVLAQERRIRGCKSRERGSSWELTFMMPQRWAQVNEVLQRAMPLAPEKRTAFLDEACAADDSLRQEVVPGQWKAGCSTVYDQLRERVALN